MKKRGTLVLHAGGGKAGSSAIQSALNHAERALSEVGISYRGAAPAASPYEITSGNGILLYDRIAQPEEDSEIGAFIEDFLGEHRVGICSSEYLGSIAKSRWKRILDAAAAKDIDIKVVYFVRSAVGYIAASYNQDVKRGGETRTIAEYARDASWQHFDDLQKLAELCGQDRLRVINYDLARGDIMGAFANSWPELEPAEQCLRTVGKLTVNRSLGGAEIEVMRSVNARIGGHWGPQISDRLILDRPELKTRLFVPDETAEILADKFAEQTKWINERFFADASAPLRVSAGVSVGDVEDQDDPRRPLAVVLDWALGRIAQEFADIGFIRNRLLNIDWHNAADRAVPPDFDPIAYLFVNEDLLRSETPPYSHYIAHGHCENRPYRWPVHVQASQDETMAEAIARLRLDHPDDWAQTPTWPRMRLFLQIEGLLHGFADRERGYLEEIRRLREEQGYEGKLFKRRMDEVVGPIDAKLDESRSNIEQKLARLTSELAVAGRQENEKLDTLNAAVASLTDRLQTETSSLRKEQSRLHALVESKDSELAAASAQLQQYRETGALGFLKWAFARDGRP